MFAGFAMYDTFIKRKGWRAPVIFLLMMSVFAALCFTALKDREQSSLLGLVLLSVGLVLPVIWVLMYIYSVRSQIKKLKLSPSKTQYVLQFGSSGVHVTKGEESADFPPKAVSSVIERNGCVYLYLEGGRAFILPKDELWEEAKGRFGWLRK